MQIRRWWTAPLLVACLATGSYSGAEEEEERDRRFPFREHGDIDAKIHHALPGIINEGADLYNCGDRAGCYRLWRGALLAFKPVLDHHPHLQRVIDDALRRAACLTCPSEQAFVLRGALDKLREATAHHHHPHHGPHMPPASKEPPRPFHHRSHERKEHEKTLWERLGGERTVRGVVSTFLRLAQNDSRLHFFRSMPHQPTEKQMEQLKEHMVEFISSRTGGPLEYRGKSMREVHKGMSITNAEFDAAEEDLRKALMIHGVHRDDIHQLLHILGDTRHDIVQPAGRPASSNQPNHWERLGGAAGVNRIVNDFLDSALRDPAVKLWHDPASKQAPRPETVARIRTGMVELISTVTGGPLEARSESLKEILKVLEVPSPQFDAFLNHLREALEKNKAPAGEIGYLIGTLKDLRRNLREMPAETSVREEPIDLDRE